MHEPYSRLETFRSPFCQVKFIERATYLARSHFVASQISMPEPESRLVTFRTAFLWSKTVYARIFYATSILNGPRRTVLITTAAVENLLKDNFPLHC